MVHASRSPQDAGSLRVAYTKEALCDLASLPKNIETRIFDKMEWYTSQDDPLYFARPLKKRPSGATHRFRVGPYRVLVTLEQHNIVVLAVAHRREAYQT
ncbi:MAG: type II toxin-antitoxin system RelE/ParE family toxin [Candidatus Peribacteraceae bacterium]|nr:type II toxin-antitoxin system RelE/ParE family toxin [Candidatus Peribacteraceae bacterium]